jgi:hypothetical protein
VAEEAGAGRAGAGVRRHLVWAGGVAALNGGLAAFNLWQGNEFWAGVLVGVGALGLLIVWAGWRSERRSDERMAELLAMYEVERTVERRRRDLERSAGNGRPG